MILGLVQLLADTSRGQSRPVVPGEALVHFVAGSDGHSAIQRSALSSPPDLAALTVMVGRLGEQAGFPLRPARIGSGEWLLVRVAMDELARRTTDRLAWCRSLARATPEPGDSTRLTTRLAFRQGSPDAQLFARATLPDGKARLDSLVGRIARRIGTPLTGVVRGDELIVEVDVDAMTLMLVEGLKKLPEIESAQPNYRVRGFGPRPK